MVSKAFSIQNIADNKLLLSFHHNLYIVSECHVEITTTYKSTKLFPISIGRTDVNIHNQKLEFMIRSNGDVHIPLILFPEDSE